MPKSSLKKSQRLLEKSQSDIKSFSPWPANAGCRRGDKMKRWLQCIQRVYMGGKYCVKLVEQRGRGSERRWVMACRGWAFYTVGQIWLNDECLVTNYLIYISSFLFFFLCFFAGALCTWTTRYQLACLAHTGSLQSPWRNSVLLLTRLQESTQHASHMNNQILPLHSNTLQPSAPSPFHFPAQFAPSINNSTSDKMEENDWACFLFMVGRQSVQLKVETVFFRFPPFLD